MQPNQPLPNRFSFSEMYQDIWNGSILGVGVSLLNPFFNAKNMRMINSPFSWNHCCRGLLINATTSIPQAAIQISAMRVMMRSLYQGKEEDQLNFKQNLIRSCVAGTLSGLFTVPV